MIDIKGEIELWMDEGLTFEEARARVREDLRQRQALLAESTKREEAYARRSLEYVQNGQSTSVTTALKVRG